MQAVLPDDIRVRFEFDQSPHDHRCRAEPGDRGHAGRPAHRADGPVVPPRLAERDRRRAEYPLRPLRRDRGPLAHRPDDQPDDPGRPGAGHRHLGRRIDRRGREHPPPDGRHRLGRPRGPAGEPADGDPPAAGDALRAGGLPAVVLHAGFGAGAVRPALAGRRLRDGQLVPALEHVRPRAVDLAAAAPSPPRGGRRARRRSRVRPGPRRLRPGRRGGRAPPLADRAGLPRRHGRGDPAGGPDARPGDLPEGRRRAVPAPPAGARRHPVRGDRATGDRRARHDRAARWAATTWRSRSATWA